MASSIDDHNAAEAGIFTAQPHVFEMDKIDKAERASSVEISLDTGVPRLDPTQVHLAAHGLGNQLSLDDVAPVDVQIRDLNVTVDTSPSILEPETYPSLIKTTFAGTKSQPDPSLHIKSLLTSLSASLAPGSLTAILGGSGSGKTTLLNTISSRISSSRLSQSGSILFNAQPGVHNVRSAYVTQTDVLLPTLTARETLQYSADLRLPSSSTARERLHVVEEVIMELGLKEAADTRVGSSIHRGLSGGEKRRVSIGVQMLANPSVLFLDEPTTGLDASSAFQLVRTLKNLAAKGRTVIVTIHQPRSEIWSLFDNLILLSRGAPVYSGPMAECLPWFETQGFQIPAFVNSAEYLIDIAAVDNRSPHLEAESMGRVERLKLAWSQESATRFQRLENATGTDLRRGMSTHKTKHATPFARQLLVMTSRTLKTTYRDPMGMVAAIMQAIIMGLCTGYIFYNLGRDQAGIRSRQGFMYTSTAVEGYLFLVFELYRLTLDLPLFDREHSEGCATPLPFLLSRRLARFVTEDLPVPILYSVISYWMAGLNTDADRFMTYFGIALINQYIAVTCAMVCVTASRHFAGASLIANLVYTLQSFACGFFIQSDTIAIWLRWTKYITYTYYIFGALCGNEFSNSFYDCPYPGGESNPECAPYTGAYILQSLGFWTGWVTTPIIVSFCFTVAFYFLSWIGLTFVTKEMTIARARVAVKDLSAGKEKMAVRSLEEVRAIDVGLDGFALELDKKSPWGKKSVARKTILHPVTATFEAGKLNVIMGPSGSGKTSLLNAMALRLNNNATTRYRPSGKLVFNGAEPSSSVIRSVCSYVCQDDDALLPSLTVRETLRFAAGLRLPSFMSTAEKHARAEEVLLKMGLKDCADNLIGNELIKGISGGEKRRVTIAVQILTDPRILLLDEPTSGLDAFTASSIMEVLRGLTAEGRTLILTIHQARSDLFRHFGNILLLSRGGQPVYSGTASSMLNYFGRLGRECPRNTNPADFVIDLITVDLQEEKKEEETRKTVVMLIEAWDRHIQDPHANTTIQGRLEPITEEITAIPKRESGDNTQAQQHHRSNEKHRLSTPAELGALIRHRASFKTSFPLLLHRAFINFRRQPPLLLARLMQVIGLAIVMAVFYAPLQSDYASIQNRVGFVQQVGAFYFVGMLQNVAVYPAERDVFYREDDDGVYSVESFLATYSLLEFPFEVISCLIFGILADLAVGFPRTPTMYFVSVFTCFGVVSCGESLGIMFNTLFSDHTGFAVTATSIILSVGNIMQGIISINMPALFNAFNYLSPLRYSVRILGPVSLRDQTFTCAADNKLPDGSCVISTGEQVLQLYKLDVDPVVNIAALAGCIIAYRLVAYLLLKVVRTRWNGKRR